MKRGISILFTAALLFSAGATYAADGDLIVDGNMGVGVADPLYKLDVNGTMKGSLITSNRNAVGLEFNMLFNATKRYTVTQSGPATLNLTSMFDGILIQSYATDAPSASNPQTILIENLPAYHTRSGAWIGWTTRYRPPLKFKIEGYDTYAGYNNWRALADYSTTPYSGYEFITQVYPGQYQKLRFTIYEGTGGLGLSELFFIHPEAVRIYAGLLPQDMWEVGTNVGIGTTNPRQKLEVNGIIQAYNNDGLGDPTAGLMSSGVRYSLNSNSTNNVFAIGLGAARNSAYDMWFQTGAANGGGYRFYRGLNELVTIDKDGNVGIGYTTPGSYKLYVNGAAYSTGGWTGSDIRLKKDIQPIEDPLSKALQLSGVTYEWNRAEFADKDLPEGRHYGVIAQEVEKVVPEIVKEGPDGTKAVAYSELIPVLIEAIKAQQKEIDALKAKMSEYLSHEVK